MNRIFLASVLTALALALPVQDVQAKRMGSGGMRRSIPAQQAPRTPPAQQATPNQAAPQAAPARQAAAPAAAAPAKRSWMGPLAGLAAGLGLAALASHFGFGEGLANFMTMALLALVAIFALRWLMRRFGPQPQGQLAGAGAGAGAGQAPSSAPLNFQAQSPSASAFKPDEQVTHTATNTAAQALPADFDAEGFARLAKQVFIRLQAANDAADQADLRRFTTPQMYASIQAELLERGNQPQRTEVLQLDATVLDVGQEAGQDVVSVRFYGLIREESTAAAQDFDEVWHLVRAADGQSWLIAGIQAA